MKTEWTPRNMFVAGGGVIAALLILPNLGKGWGVVRYVTDAFPAAYAGESGAKEVRSDFDRYITQREEELKLEKQRNELQEEYNQKLLQLQQQQAPNQYQHPYAQPIVEYDQDQVPWCCDTNQQDCWDRNLWYRCGGR